MKPKTISISEKLNFFLEEVEKNEPTVPKEQSRVHKDQYEFVIKTKNSEISFYPFGHNELQVDIEGQEVNGTARFIIHQNEAKELFDWLKKGSVISEDENQKEI
jgi:hypothetical protein